MASSSEFKQNQQIFATLPITTNQARMLIFFPFWNYLQANN